MLFGEILTGWICFSPTQAAIRSKLFDSGCILKEELMRVVAFDHL